LLGDVTVGGTTPSNITRPGTSAANIRLTSSTGNRTFNVANATGGGADLTVAAPLIDANGGTSSLTKAGDGVMVLASTSTYSGSTTISGGTLRLSGPAPAVQNGAFDAPGLGANSYTYYNSMSAAQKAAFVWTSSSTNGQGGALVNNSTAWGYTMPYPSPSQAFSLQRDAVISESLYFTPGVYTISWSHARRGSQVNPYYFQLNGVSQGATISAPGTAWSTVSTTFTIPTAGNYTIGFLGTGSTDLSVALDDISLSGGQLPSATAVSITAAGASLDLNGVTQTIGSLAGVADSSVLLGGATLTTGGDGSSTTFAGDISGSGLVIKTGGGTWLVDGSISAPVNVLAGTLGGTATIAGAVNVAAGAHLAPGDSPGRLWTGSLTLAPDSLLDIELTPTAWDMVDMADLAGSVSLADAILNLSTTGNFAAYGGSQYMIINNEGPDAIDGTFVDMLGQNLPEGSILNVGQGQFALTYVGGNGNDVVLTAVPEPATALLVMLAVPAVAARLRRRVRTRT